MESRNFAIIRATKYDAGAVLQAPASVVARRRRSHDMGTVPPPDTKAQPHSDRFWSKVNKDGPIPEHCPELGPCSEWTAFVQPSGYGMYRLGDVIVAAHRLAYEMENGPIPKGLLATHACDNRKCVNPSHIEPGTAKKNAQDRCKRGRSVHYSGAKNGRAKV